MPSLAKHNYVSCLMQITLPGIDNYTLYYETFVFILRVYSIMLFDYVYRCAHNHPPAQFVRSGIIANLPMCERRGRGAKARKRKAMEKRRIEDDIYPRARTRSRTYRNIKRRLLRRHYDPGKERLRARPPGPNRIKSSFARSALSG